MLAREKLPASPRGSKMTALDDARLLRRIDALVARWESGEGVRRARDRRGMRLFRGEIGEPGLGDTGRTLIKADTATALFERVAAEVLRGSPEPEIEATNDDDEDAARIAEGALRTNWRVTQMRTMLANAYRLCGFTRAVGFYHYWRHEANGGKGDVDRRVIPGHRLIVDDRALLVRDMKFHGFEEDMSRAELITLFPERAREIESAGEAQAQKPAGLSNDPLRPTKAGGPEGLAVVDRLVAQGAANQPPYTPTQSIKVPGGRGKTADPLSEKVTVRFLWLDDPTPIKEKRPRLDPKSKRPMYEIERHEETGKPVFEDGGHEVLDTPLGPQYIPSVKPKYRMVLDDVIVRKYKYLRHVAYVPEDQVKLWDVSWDGPSPISILRDRLPAYGFDAPGTAQRLGSLNIARNILWTIIFERLKKSLGGTWITSTGSGLKRNALMNEIGAVFTVNGDINQAVKEFPTSPLDAAYFNLLGTIEQEMESLVGVTPLMRGQAIGRADSPQTYQQVADESGGTILDRAKLIDQFISDAANIDLWFMQNYYTHEHVVEVETAEGFSTWTEASALAMRGEFAVRVDTGSTLKKSATQERTEAQDGAQAGFYALPMLGRVGRYRNWRQALKQRAHIMALGPQYAWLLGASGAPPTQQAMGLRAQSQRSHHKPGGK